MHTRQSLGGGRHGGAELLIDKLVGALVAHGNGQVGWAGACGACLRPCSRPIHAQTCEHRSINDTLSPHLSSTLGNSFATPLRSRHSLKSNKIGLTIKNATKTFNCPHRHILPHQRQAQEHAQVCITIAHCRLSKESSMPSRERKG